VLVVAFATAAPACAQGGDRNDARADRVDRQIGRAVTSTSQAQPSLTRGSLPQIMALSSSTAPGPDETKSKNKPADFFISFSLPGYWTNNAGYDEDGGRSAFHVSPAAQLGVIKSLSAVTVEARVTVASDIYSRATENNGSFLRARLQATFTGASDALGGFTPYLRYQPRLDFSDAKFGDSAGTKHDMVLGASAELKKGADLELFVIRREASKSAAERWQPGATLTFADAFKGRPNLGWSVEQSFEGLLYTGGSNDGRKDFYSSTDAVISWHREKSHVTVNLLEVQVEWNRSNRPSRDFFVVNVGAGLSAKF